MLTIRLRHFPEYDSKEYPPYDFLSEVLDTDQHGELRIPVSVANLEQRPFYWVTLRIEATPPDVSFSVRRIVTDPPNGGLVVGSGFAHIG